MNRSQDHLKGFINITTAVNVKIAAEAPTKLVPGGKKGILNGKLSMPPRKKAVSIFPLEFVTLSNVFPKTYRKIMLPSM
jgi:hypothetical protein